MYHRGVSNGDRVAETLAVAGVNGTRTDFILDTATPLTMVLSETNETTQVTTRYWHALDTLAQSDGSTTEYFAYDGLGSVRQLVDETGSVTLAQTFDPYGTGYATSGSASSSLGWTGEQVDANGFVYLRARYYAPGMGRFTQMDPSRLERNAYQYSAGNPVKHVDPNGLCAAASYVPYSPPGIMAWHMCLDIVHELEAQYDLTFYWPKRMIDLDARNIILNFDCPDDRMPYPIPDTNIHPELQPWSLAAVKRLRETQA